MSYVRGFSDGNLQTTRERMIEQSVGQLYSNEVIGACRWVGSGSVTGWPLTAMHLGPLLHVDLARQNASVIVTTTALEMCHLLLCLRHSPSLARQNAFAIATILLETFHSTLCRRPSQAVATGTVAQVSTPPPPTRACPARPRADLSRPALASLVRGRTRGRRAEVGWSSRCARRAEVVYGWFPRRSVIG